VEVDPDRLRVGRLDGEQGDCGKEKQAFHDTSIKR
jgi:hypothetical protein